MITKFFLISALSLAIYNDYQMIYIINICGWFCCMTEEIRYRNLDNKMENLYPSYKALKDFDRTLRGENYKISFDAYYK